MPIIARKIAKPVVSFMRKRAVLKKIPELETFSGSTLSNKIAFSIKLTLEGVLAEEERAKIEQIEKRRASLLSNLSLLEFEDFGAGVAEHNVSLQEAAKGRKSHRTIADIARASKARQPCLLLFNIVRTLKPNNILEMGSCVGISGSYLSAAQILNGHGSLVTLEGSATVADIARETLGIIGGAAKVVTGPFNDTLKNVSRASAPVDLLFNDGHHDGLAVIKYYDVVRPCLSEPAVVFLDDISWSVSMARAFKHLCESEGVSLSIDFGNFGLFVWEPDSSSSQHFKMKM